jgi:glycosyltransferase involved in cell wall biosynthesis
MKFSVATPVLNAADKIRRCVGSVRNQTYSDWEHIIQDGGSTDGTWQWLEKQGRKEWGSEPDDGMYFAIEKAWGRSSGQILSWLNADEQYLPGTLKLVAETFASNPDIDIVSGNTIVVDDSGMPLAARREIPLRRIYVANGFLNSYSCSTFFRRRLFESGWLKFDHSYRYAADMDMVLGLLERKATALHIDQYLSLFGVNWRNISSGPELRREMLMIQDRHGIQCCRALRSIVMLGRYIERLWRGCYIRRDVDYEYVVDEVPCTKSVHAERVQILFDIFKLKNAQPS